MSIAHTVKGEVQVIKTYCISHIFLIFLVYGHSKDQSSYGLILITAYDLQYCPK